MSAYMVSKTHIDAMVTAAVEFSSSGTPLAWHWIEDSRILEREDAGQIGAMLLAENRCSVDYRYQEDERKTPYEGRHEMTLTYQTPDTITAHVADRIEPGAILYSSWGYDQTNVDFYMVIRTTKASAWIVPMSQEVTRSTGYMSGRVIPLEPLFVRHVYDRETGETHERAIAPEMHRIKRYGSGDSLNLNSVASAWLWDGAEQYASSYA